VKQRGVFEKVPGSGVWWIRYFDQFGKKRREKAGKWATARDLYIKRKAEILQGCKLPEKLRQRPVRFREVADDAIAYIKQEYARPADDVARTEVVKEWFEGRAAESITREEVKAALNSATEGKKVEPFHSAPLPECSFPHISPRPRTRPAQSRKESGDRHSAQESLGGHPNPANEGHLKTGQ